MSLTLAVAETGLEYELKPSKIIAVGLNYREHIAESVSVEVKGMDGEEPAEPVLFNKTPNVLIGPGTPIPIPSVIHDYPWAGNARTDYEGELVVIIGRNGKHIPEDMALDFVYGYTCGNDVSQRNLQNSDRSGWFRGKSFDGFGPVGPVIIPSMLIPDPGNLSIRTRLNGKTVQSSNTSMMIFPVSRIISHISRQMSLKKGDLIFTGTPAGVGPLKDGDVVEVEIEKIGILANPVINEHSGGAK
jgi:2-keto-4-pentenoate hydratase/2-oxohepta-3-ene-1,7-dioic acid hydratase in catechol pathway